MYAMHLGLDWDRTRRDRTCPLRFASSFEITSPIYSDTNSFRSSLHTRKRRLLQPWLEKRDSKWRAANSRLKAEARDSTKYSATTTAVAGTGTPAWIAPVHGERPPTCDLTWADEQVCSLVQLGTHVTATAWADSRESHNVKERQRKCM